MAESVDEIDANREFRLAHRPEGKPDPDVFDLVTTEVPEPDHGQVLLRTCYLSVDPYMRGRMRDTESYAEPWDVGEPLHGHVVGEVVESRHDDFEPGDFATAHLDWAEYNLAEGHDLRKVDPGLAPLPAYLGVLGMPGRTAYFGTLDVAEPQPGDTVVVSGAAGAVGSVAGQIAKLSGCDVVGFAGSDEKIDYLTEDLGFDAGINYKSTDDYEAALDDAAPDGVDVYFDNVGGPITDAVFTRLNLDARVAICGQISLYNATQTPTGPRKLWSLIRNRARVEGFLVGDFEPRFDQAEARLAEWIRNGDIKYRETITDGFENAPDAFLGLFEGENIGKQVVKVAEPSV